MKNQKQLKINFNVGYKVLSRITGKLYELIDKKLLIRIDDKGEVESSNRELTLTQLMSQSEKEISMDSLLVKLGQEYNCAQIICPPFTIERERRDTWEEIKEAKLKLKNNISSGENVIQWFSNRLPNWGLIKFNGVIIPTV